MAAGWTGLVHVGRDPILDLFPVNLLQLLVADQAAAEERRERPDPERLHHLPDLVFRAIVLDEQVLLDRIPLDEAGVAGEDDAVFSAGLEG